MRIPWWLHRALIMVLMPAGALVGAVGALYAVSSANDLLGRAAVILYPLGFVLGALVPHQIFRRLIHAECPVDGEAMVIERVTLPLTRPTEVPRTGTRYRCPTCGTTK